MTTQNEESIADIISEFNTVLSGLAAGSPAQAAPAPVLNRIPTPSLNANAGADNTPDPHSLSQPVFRYALFAPAGKTFLCQTFTDHLLEIAQKTMKKEYIADLAICEEIDYTVHNEAVLVDRCLSLKIPAVFMIGPSRRAEVRKGVLCRWLSEAEVGKRFLYVDIVLELVQLQKLKSEAAV